MIIQQRLAEILVKSGSSAKFSDVDISKSFSQIGLDSLDVYSFFSEIEIELGVKIQDDDVPDLVSMEKVIEYVSERIA